MRIIIIDTSAQNFVFLVGLNFVCIVFFLMRNGRIRIDMASATTPPSFEGIDRRIT